MAQNSKRFSMSINAHLGHYPADQKFEFSFLSRGDHNSGDTDVLEKAMTLGGKSAELKNMEQPSTDRLESTPSDIEAAYSLSLRHETALAWVMPDGWEPRHG
jgi:hypothetical protein